MKNPFTPQAEFDFQLLREHARKAQRIMDDIIDLEAEKIDLIIEKIEKDPEVAEVKTTELNLWKKIREKTLKGRRTGCGTTGEGDMLAALSLRYGTPEATALSVEVHKTLALAYYGASVDLAAERGAFEIYNPELEKDNPYINRLREADPEMVAKMEKTGRRNIACLTIAPTGTTSIMTQTSSGIEPVFMPVYQRRRKVNPSDENVRIDFVDEVGDSFEEFVVYHHKFLEWMRINGIEVKDNLTPEELESLVAKSPYYKATANDVDWLEKVRMQGAIQKWVDHSISVTINLPNDVSEELVATLYAEAWKCGCKGCTVYRDGSRNNVLEAVPKKEEKQTAENSSNELIHLADHVAKRPVELEADVVRFQNNKENGLLS